MRSSLKDSFITRAAAPVAIAATLLTAGGCAHMPQGQGSIQNTTRTVQDISGAVGSVGHGANVLNGAVQAIKNLGNVLGN